MIDEDKVLKLYSNTSASIMNAGHDIISSTYVSKYFNCTLYRARKIIKSLVDQELLKPACESGYDDYSEMPYVIRGYNLTQKGRASKAYRIALWNEAKICSEVWGDGTPYDYFRGIRL